MFIACVDKNTSLCLITCDTDKSFMTKSCTSLKNKIQKQIEEAHYSVFSVLSIPFSSFLLYFAILMFMFINSWPLLLSLPLSKMLYTERNIFNWVLLKLKSICFKSKPQTLFEKEMSVLQEWGALKINIIQVLT